MTTEASDSLEVVLVMRATKGDRGAYSDLLGLWYQAAIRVAQAVLNRRDGAEDVVQEVAFRCFERLHQLEGNDHFGPWFLQSVRNMAKNRIRKRKRDDANVSIEADYEPTPAANSPGARRGHAAPSMDAEAEETQQMLARAMAKLPETQRLCLVLHSVDGHSHKEVALILGISEELSKFNVCVARKKIKAALERELER